jgi:hypothetical protein
MSRHDELVATKARLSERIAGQRQRLAAQIEAVQPLFRAADGAVSAARSIRAHPEWLAVAAAIAVALRPRRTIVWLRRGFVAWRTWTWVKRAAADRLHRA